MYFCTDSNILMNVCENFYENRRKILYFNLMGISSILCLYDQISQLNRINPKKSTFIIFFVEFDVISHSVTK